MDIQVRVIPDFVSMILVLLAFVVLLLILGKLLYKPVSEALEKRRENIQKNIDDAKASKEEALTLKQEYEAKILEAKKESQEIIEQGRKRGEEVRESIVLEAREEANNIIEKAKREIQAEKEKAVLDLQVKAGEMAVLIASKVIEENIDMAKQQDLINKFVDEVGMREWQN